MAARHDQRLASDFIDRVFEFGRAIGRIDVDQNGADAGGAELGVKPFGAIGCPDTDPVATSDAERQQAGGDVVRAFAQIVPGQRKLVLSEDSSSPPTMPGASAI